MPYFHLYNVSLKRYIINIFPLYFFTPSKLYIHRHFLFMGFFFNFSFVTSSSFLSPPFVVAVQGAAAPWEEEGGRRASLSLDLGILRVARLTCWRAFPRALTDSHRLLQGTVVAAINRSRIVHQLFVRSCFFLPIRGFQAGVVDPFGSLQEPVFQSAQIWWYRIFLPLFFFRLWSGWHFVFF